MRPIHIRGYRFHPLSIAQVPFVRAIVDLVSSLKGVVVAVKKKPAPLEACTHVICTPAAFLSLSRFSNSDSLSHRDCVHGLFSVLPTPHVYPYVHTAYKDDGSGIPKICIYIQSSPAHRSLYPNHISRWSLSSLSFSLHLIASRHDVTSIFTPAALHTSYPKNHAYATQLPLRRRRHAGPIPISSPDGHNLPPKQHALWLCSIRFPIRYARVSAAVAMGRRRPELQSQTGLDGRGTDC